MPVPTLYELTRTRLIQNIHMLDDIGELPYDFLSTILRHIQNPDQLLQLERNCPQIVGETGEIWLRFIKRDIPNWDHKPHEPKDPKNWSKVYRRLKRDAEKEKAEQEEKLRETMRALQQNRANTQTTIVEGKVGFDPSRRRVSAYKGSGWGSSGAPPKTGKMAFDKLRRGMYDRKQAMPKAAQIPAHLLAERKGTVRQAPERMMRMREVEAEAPSRMSASRNPAEQAVPQQNIAASPSKPRASLPTGVHFSVPKIRTQPAAAAPAPKRKRQEPNLFMQQKRGKQ